MENLLYKIGDYNPKIVKAGRLGAKFLLPGLSLMIVLITSCWGGYHLAGIAVENDLLPQVGFTVGFVVLVLIVDFSLLNLETKGFTAFIRVLLSLSLGTLISVLTSLSIYKTEIEKKLSGDIDKSIKTEMTKYDSQINRADSLVILYANRSRENERKAGIEKYQGNKDIGSPAGEGKEYQRYIKSAKQDSIESYKQESLRDSLKAHRQQYENQFRRNQENTQLKGLNGRIISIFKKTQEEPVTWFPLIIIFIALMIFDLMPILIKYGSKNTLDNKYEEFLNKLRTERDTDGNLRWYDAALEKFFMENEKQKSIIEYEKQKEIEKTRRAKEVTSKLEEAKEVYAMTKLQKVIDKIQKWGEASRSDESTHSNISDFANRIKNGENVTSAEDLQFYQNHATEIESELQQS